MLLLKERTGFHREPILSFESCPQWAQFYPLNVYLFPMASRFTIYSINQISDLIYQISYIIYKILYQISYINKIPYMSIKISDMLYKISDMLYKIS